MTLRWADRVADTSTTTGTGNITTAGSPPASFIGFANIPSITTGDTFYFGAADQSGSAWEVNVGTVVTVSPFVFSRGATPIASSNGGALVNFMSGALNVWLDVPAMLNDTPSFGAAKATSLALGGATIGSDALAVTGSVSAGAVVATSLALGGATIGSNALSVTGQVQTNAAILTSQAATGSRTQLVFGNSTINSGIGFPYSNVMTFVHAGTEYFFLFGNNLCLQSGIGLSFDINSHTVLIRDGVDYIMAQANGANPNTFRVYNTSTSSNVNFERGAFGWTDTANVLTIGTQMGGTGVARNMQFVIGGSTKADFGIANAGAWTFATAVYTGAIISSGTVGAAAASQITWGTRSVMTSPADGSIRLTNTAQTDFTSLQFGGTTSSFPALKRSTTSIQARLADDSAYATIQGKLKTDTNYTVGTFSLTGYLTLYDATGTAYRVPCAV